MLHGLFQVYLSNQKEESIVYKRLRPIEYIVLTKAISFSLYNIYKLVRFLYYRQSMVWCGCWNFNNVLQDLRILL